MNTVWRNRIVGYGEESPGRLLANPFNFRIHPDEQQAALSGALRQVGIVQNVLVNRTTGHVLDGHLRVAIAIKEGQAAVPVTYVEVSEAEERIILASFDKISSMAGIDQAMLDRLIGEIQASEPDLNPEMDALLQGLLSEPEQEITPGLTDDDEVPDAPSEPTARPGDLWLLDNHRVLCGDSTQIEAFERLMRGKIPDLVLTDPPYGINIVKVKGEREKGVVGGAKPLGFSEGVVVGGGSAGAMYPFGGVKKGVVGGKNIVRPKLYAPIINDGGTETAASFYFLAAQAGIQKFIIFGGNYFTDFLPVSSCWVIWDKRNSGNFADAEMAWTSFTGGTKLYSYLWNGLSREGDRKTELLTRVHPTQKPVGLFEKIFADFQGNTVYDGFLGSGSTLIACQKTNRACYGMELSPDYIDVIVNRWQNFTGKQATLEGDGRTFRQIQEERQLVAV